MEPGEAEGLTPVFSNVGWDADIKTFQQKGLPTPDTTVSLIFKDFDLADHATNPFAWGNLSGAIVGVWESLKKRRASRQIKGWIRADWEGNSVAIFLPDDPSTLKNFLKNLREFLLSNHETLKTSVVSIQPTKNAEVDLRIVT